MRRQALVRVGMLAALVAVGLTMATGEVTSRAYAWDSPKSAEKSSDRVDINTATVDELIALPGIGETTAQRIVRFREENGPFQRVEDLLKVKGIGEKSFQKLRPSIKVSRPRSG